MNAIAEDNKSLKLLNNIKNYNKYYYIIIIIYKYVFAFMAALLTVSIIFVIFTLCALSFVNVGHHCRARNQINSTSDVST